MATENVTNALDELIDVLEVDHVDGLGRVAAVPRLFDGHDLDRQPAHLDGASEDPAIKKKLI